MNKTPPPTVVWSASSGASPLVEAQVCRRRETISRDRRGRVILPPWDCLNPHDAAYPYSEAELDCLLKEVGRRRRNWNILAGLALAGFTAFLVLTYIVLPAMAIKFGLF